MPLPRIPSIRVLQNPREMALGLIHQVNATTGRACPCHGGARHDHHHHSVTGGASRPKFASTINTSTDYAFEMAASSIRYGEGVTQEVGMDCANLHAKRVLVVTDPKIAKLSPLKRVLDSLKTSGVSHDVFDQVRVEPTDSSFAKAIAFAKNYKPDVIVAVGGGSTMDTAKAANLYSTYLEADFLDFVNPPIGKGLPVDRPLKPLIAIPTTAGTGSETTGTTIFDYEALGVKTGIAHRNLRPMLGIVDPLNTQSMPPQVRAASGLDVLCHALESYTAIPYNQRSPRPDNPLNRPAYQGANPISDIWSLKALGMVIQALPRSVKNPDDYQAQADMLLASTYAGIGFGNAGVHLCHGMSYPISGLVKNYHHPGYPTDHSIVPHGVSVAMTSPAVFKFTGAACPERHLEAAKLFVGADVSNARLEDAGTILSEKLREFLYKLDQLPNGLTGMGFQSSDIAKLVEGTLPQQRVLKLAPAGAGQQENLTKLFESSMSLF
ncbi:alcohol dehydrogenase [Piptocephalis cylindrospora]|uniref:Alcohol dehydrogenase n=1 Tax=Piptocephalis cylindrospora TaxID=1907219 RepID=A0A4P9Y6H3_9FUNG|nr:alcohol dehydrogenase [Piptocephalis cylindrospora]|eukprot:RKP14382.1 alcohol dehydrogenase [Piptocephalis cylindrospora]